MMVKYTMSSPFSVKNLLQGTNPKRYLKSAFWLTLSRVTSMAVSLVATFYIARTIGPQNFGELSYAQSVVGILSIVSALTVAIYRDLIQKTQSENILLGTAWTISFVGAFVTSIASLCFALLFPHDSLTILIIAILCLAQFFSPFTIISNVFYAKTETKLLSIANLFVHIIVSISKVVAMLMGEGVIILALIMVFEQILMASTYTYLYLHEHNGAILKWRLDINYGWQLIKDSFPLAILMVSGVISARVDQIFIKHYLDTTTVGLYSVSVQLSEMWQFIPGLILTAAFPAIVNAKHSHHIYKKRLFVFGLLFLLYGLSISAFLTLFAPILINLIYGDAFLGAIPLLQLYCWSITGTVLGFLVSQTLLNENLRQVQLACGLIPMFLNVILNIILIPQFGASGAAIATVISYSTGPFIPFTFSSVRKLFVSKPENSP